jgi:predicted TPR repeat methyltransferase
MDKNSIAVAVFDKQAAVYQEKYMNVDDYNDAFNLFCNSIDKLDASILEIACGPGNVTKNLLQKKPDFKILATDLSPNMLQLAKANNPTARFEILDGRAIGQLPDKYDGVMCAFLFPYLSKEEGEQFIADAATVLNDEGVLYISTMADDYNKSDWMTASNGDKVFMYYHQSDYLIAALAGNGFEMIDEATKTTTWKDGTIVTDLILIARKKGRGQ